MTDSVAIDPAKIQQWMEKHMDAKGIEEELRTLGFDQDSIESYIREFKKVKYAKRQINGFIYISFGALLGFISCVLTIVNPVPELHDVFLFGLTSISVIIVFIGLYYLFEG